MAISPAYPSGEEGGNFLVQMVFTYRGGGGGRHPVGSHLESVACRNYGKRMPNILPRLLDAVKWQSRDEVSQLYLLLEDWRPVSTQVRGCPTLTGARETDSKANRPSNTVRPPQGIQEKRSHFGFYDLLIKCSCSGLRWRLGFFFSLGVIRALIMYSSTVLLSLSLFILLC